LLDAKIQEATMRWACNYNRETRNAYRILVAKSLGKRSHRRQRRWEDNIEINLKEKSCDDGW
jgi:hypothetical protein